MDWKAYLTISLNKYTKNTRLIILYARQAFGPKYKILFIDTGRCGMSANETTLHPSHNL